MLSRILPLAAKAGASIFAVSLFAIMPAANAQILTQFTFGTVDNTGTTGTGYNPTTTAANIAASNLSLTSGTSATMLITNPTPAYTSRVLIFNPNGTVAGATPATTAAAAVANNRSFDFSVTPNAGFQTSFGSLTFDVARGGGAIPRGYVVRSSVDGFAANLASADVLTQRAVQTAITVDLSGGAFQNLTGATTFRIYSYSPDVNNSLDYDNVTLNGAATLVAVVPESSTLALLSLAGGMGAMVLAYRRKK